jgi:hypothetical protein
VWVWDLVNAAITGLATSMGTVITGEAVGALNFTPRQLIAVAISGAVFGAINYIRQRRLPELYPDSEE